MRARRACSLQQTDSWLGASPDFLVASLLADCKFMIVKYSNKAPEFHAKKKKTHGHVSMPEPQGK